jgi:hypothetical protein
MVLRPFSVPAIDPGNFNVIKTFLPSALSVLSNLLESTAANILMQYCEVRYFIDHEFIFRHVNFNDYYNSRRFNSLMQSIVIERFEKFPVDVEYKPKVHHRQYKIQVITHIVAC